MAGDGFVSGAMGDGISQLAQKQLGNIKDLNIRLIASMAVGAAAAKVVGGNAQAGASAAYNGVKYNDYGHRPTRPGSLIYSNGKPPTYEGRGFYKVGSDGNEYYQSNGINVGDVFWETTGTYDENGIEIGKESIVAADGTHIYFNWKEVDGVNVAVYDDTKAQVIVNGKSIIKAEDLEDHWYKSWLVQTGTSNALFWAKVSLQLKGLDPDDPANGHELSDEVEQQKQSLQDSMNMTMGASGSIKIVGNVSKLTSIYRAVGPSEFYELMKTGEFSVIPIGMQAKQFGLNLEETTKFAEKFSDIAAVIEVKVPANMLNKLADFTQVDGFIFKNGTITIQAANLAEFNKIIQEINHVY